MIEKIINLLESNSPINWELAIQLSEANGLCEKVHDIVFPLDHALWVRFLKPANRIDTRRINVDEFNEFIHRLEKSGFDVDVNFETSRGDGMCLNFTSNKGNCYTWYYDVYHPLSNS